MTQAEIIMAVRKILFSEEYKVPQFIACGEEAFNLINSLPYEQRSELLSAIKFYKCETMKPLEIVIGYRGEELKEFPKFVLAPYIPRYGVPLSMIKVTGWKSLLHWIDNALLLLKIRFSRRKVIKSKNPKGLYRWGVTHGSNERD
jgi:hypothetical protein